MEPQVTYLIRLTPPGTGAVATLLLDGLDAKSIINQKISPILPNDGETERGQSPHFAQFFLHSTASTQKECHEKVVVFEKNENTIEIHPHGGETVLAALESELISLGAKRIDSVIWSRQEKKRPAIQNEALEQLGRAETEFACKILLAQYLGKLVFEMQGILQDIREQKIEKAKNRIATLLNRGTVHLTVPFQVVLAGPVNVGKSSLLNAMLGFERAIVSSVPGTTRDLVTYKTAVNGWPILLIDTAGMRETAHPLERLGIELSESVMADADLVLNLADARQPEKNEDFPNFSKPVIHVFNKIDLLEPEDFSSSAVEGTFFVSAKTGAGIESLLQGIIHRLVPHPPSPDDAVPFTQNQIETLKKIKASLDLGDCETATMLLEDGLI